MKTMWKIAAVLSVITLVFICVMPHANAATRCPSITEFVDAGEMITGRSMDYEHMTGVSASQYVEAYDNGDGKLDHGSVIELVSVHVQPEAWSIYIRFNDETCRRLMLMGRNAHERLKQRANGMST